MKVFLIQGVEHYMNLVESQVAHPELKEQEEYKDMLELKRGLAGACCSTRRQILDNMNDVFEILAKKVVEGESEMGEKLTESFNCEQLVFSCMDSRKNVKQELTYERQTTGN